MSKNVFDYLTERETEHIKIAKGTLSLKNAKELNLENLKNSYLEMLDDFLTFQYMEPGTFFNFIFKKYDSKCDSKSPKRFPLHYTPGLWNHYDELAEKAFGDVLLIGLGLGQLTWVMQDNEDVDSITVIENRIELINLLKIDLHFDEKVNIIYDDVDSMYKSVEKLYDCVILDFDESSFGITRMADYHRIYDSFLNKKSKGAFIHVIRGSDYEILRELDQRMISTTSEEQALQILKNYNKFPTRVFEE